MASFHSHQVLKRGQILPRTSDQVDTRVDEQRSGGGQRNRRPSFHEQQVLPYRFDREAAAAERARVRAAAWAKRIDLEQAELKERERLSRWYNCVDSERKRGGPKRAAKRNRQWITQKTRKENVDAAELSVKWYSNREPAPDALTLSKERVTKRKRRARSALRVANEKQKLETERVKNALEQLSKTRLEALNKSNRISWEELRILQQVKPFVPGPYSNPIESVYGCEEIGGPRTFFSLSPFG